MCIRDRYLLDLSNPHVCRYILDAMRKLLGGHPGISYVKWDCNRKISDPGSPWLDACRQGNLPIDYVRGYERILETLAAEFPDVIFQACSSGGGRADSVSYTHLQNYDEFTQLKALQKIDKADSAALEAFKNANFLTDEDIAAMQGIDVLKERTVQDYRSAYNDIRDWFRRCLLYTSRCV